MIVVDLAAVLGAGCLDDLTTASGVGGRHEAGQPPVGQATDATQLGRCDAAQPHVHVLLERFGQHLQRVVVKVLAVVSQRFGRPAPTQHLHRFVEDLGAGPALDTERLLLVRVRHAQSEGGQ